MDGINVISINPGQTTRAAMHPEVFERIAREYKLTTDEARSRHIFRDWMNFVFGLNGKTSSGMSAKLLSLRLIAGSGLASLGAFASATGMPESAGIASMVYGGLLMTGLTTRISSTAAFGYFGWIIAASAFAGVFNSLAVIPAFIALIFMVLGPGFYSGDQIIRKSAIRGMRRRIVKKKMQKAEDRLSYKAFASANYR